MRLHHMAVMRLHVRATRVAPNAANTLVAQVRSVVVWCLMHPSDVANPVPVSCWPQGRTAVVRGMMCASRLVCVCTADGAAGSRNEGL